MSRLNVIFGASVTGILGMLALLSAYLLILTAVSGWDFTLDQFYTFWYFIVSLAVGFGIQTGLYTYLRGAVHQGDGSGKVLAVSGTTSTAAMISCCAHYLTNILPVLGTAGIITLVAQYQTELFWFGLASNAAGITYIGSKVIRFSRAHT
ncbi:MAG: hypothetical protein HYY45_01155 [Deltaproteobacteria bacterium]|nr:hypothetical protein [Deltaproteobacteria bacterium]